MATPSQNNITGLQEILDAVNNLPDAGGGGVDLTGDTVTADKMLLGITAHNEAGEPIVGTIANYDGSHECSGDSTGGGATVETCTVTFNSNNDSYSNIYLVRYTTVDSTGIVVGAELKGKDITTPFSIQCVCNTGIDGLFPPTSALLITETNITRSVTAVTNAGTFYFGTLTAQPNGTATVTFD